MEEVEERPRQHNDVVNVEPSRHDRSCVADTCAKERVLQWCIPSSCLVSVLTFEDGTQLPHAETTDAEVLAERELHEEHWDSGEEQSEEVRYEERP